MKEYTLKIALESKSMGMESEFSAIVTQNIFEAFSAYETLKDLWINSNKKINKIKADAEILRQDAKEHGHPGTPCYYDFTEDRYSCENQEDMIARRLRRKRGQ